MNVFVVLNPVAGRSRPADVRRTLEKAFERAGWRTDFYQTTGDEHVGSVVNEAVANGAQIVVAAGGDGTVSAVADGLAETGIPMGIVPTGTGNVVAQELGIPTRIGRAAKVITNAGKTRPIDALKVGNRFYVLSVGTGLDAMTIEKTDRQDKRRLGPLAYVIAVVRVLIGIQPRTFTIEADGVRREMKAADVLVTNVGTLTRPIRWGPHIRPDDGQIDICIIRATSLFDVIGVAWDILVPIRQRRERNLRYWSARESVTIATDTPMPVQGDGDIVGETPVDIKIVSRAVNVLAPDGNGRRLGERLRSRVERSIRNQSK